MTKKLPPLNALRAFEASARKMSFTKAAEELFVSPAAVSQQVKTLEEFLGIKLFSRTHKNLQLTAAGEAYLPMISDGFNAFAKAGQKLSALQSGRSLTVSVLPSVASKWLAPKLFYWLEEHSGVEVRIVAAHQEVDFQIDDVDFRISYGSPEYEGCIRQELLVDEVYPVCSPALLEQYPIESSADLAKHTFLHVYWGDEYKSLPGWSDWLNAVGAEGVDSADGPRFNLSSMAIQAAIDGKGVMLGQNMMVAEDIAAGRLVRLFELALPLQEAYCVIYPEVTLAKGSTVEFLDWLVTLGE